VSKFLSGRRCPVYGSRLVAAGREGARTTVSENPWSEKPDWCLAGRKGFRQKRAIPGADRSLAPES
jgi:hypothetical protein